MERPSNAHLDLDYIIMNALDRYNLKWAEDGRNIEDVRQVSLRLGFDGDTGVDAVINIQVPLSNLEMPVVTFSKVSSSCLVVETAIQKALANDVILEKIFGDANVRDLKKIRMVNRKWEEVGSNILKRRRVFIKNSKLLAPLPPNAIENGRHINQRQRIAASVNELIKVSQGSRGRFIGNSLCLNSEVWRLSNVATKKFLELHGQFIRYMELNYHYDSRSLPSLWQMIVKHLSNLEEIYVKEFELKPRCRQIPDSWLNFAEEYEDKIQYCLRKLTKIRFADFPHHMNHSGPFQVFWRDIILRARNIQEVVNLPCRLLDAVSEAGKLHTVKSVSIRCQISPECGPCLEKLSVAPTIALSCLKTLLVEGETANSWRRLLESKKETLKEMFVYSCLTPMEIPTLPKVRDLHLRIGFKPIFAAGANLAGMFPNLSTVHLSLLWGADLQSCFPEDNYTNNSVDISTSTKAINIVQAERLLTFIPNLLLKFPSVNEVRIDFSVNCELYKHTPELCSIIWNYFRHVEIIELYGVIYKDLRIYALDSVLTGIPRGICRNLLRKFSGRTAEFDLRLFQTAPSILHLENLKKFTLRFLGKEGGDGNPSPLATFLTEVSAWCVFSRMPHTEFVFSYDPDRPRADELSTLLAPFSQYATISHVEDTVGP